MDPQRHRRIKEIFLAACALEPGKQRELIEKACGEDSDLRREVESLLESDRAGRTPLEELSPRQELLRLEKGLPSGAAESFPAAIGGYRIIRKLGEGGMGMVYEAEQASPRRRVALKVIQGRMVSAALLRRFEREAEVLGQLQHPGIARIYQAGASDEVQPYFAMELIAGQPLLEHARSAGLGSRERLELLAQICDAVQHAHDRGIIHRDLKPGNILVDAAGQPKVLDFGVARLTESDLQAATGETTMGQIVGTLPYMSPEQATGDPAALDHRTDVYSLGVILHQLLTGRLPHDVDSKPLPEALRVIREEEPSRIGSLSKVFRGDIETIVSKALEKRKDRRYRSPADLAADIRRYLASQPIVARPSSALYGLQKFARRNKALVAGVACACGALVLGTVVSLWQAGVAVRERRLAERRTEQALLQSYRASLAAAAAGVAAADPMTVQEQLEAVDPALREWGWRYWWSQNDRSVSLWEAGEPVPGAAFGEDGRRVVVALRSGRLQWWDPREGEETGPLDLGASPLHLAAFDRGGRRVAAAFGPGARAVGLWETSGGSRIAELTGLEHPCHSLALSADGRHVVGASMERSAWIWDGSSRPISIPGEQLAEAAFPRVLAFMPHLPQVVVGGYQGWLGAFDLRTGARGAVRDLPTLHIHCFRFNRAGSLIALGESSSKIYLGDVATGRPLAEFVGHLGGVQAIDLSPDETLLASAGDRTVRLWSLTSGKSTAVLTGHSAEVRSVSFSPDGAHLLSSSLDGALRLWHAEPSDSVTVMMVPDSYARAVALAADGHLVLGGSWNGRLQAWDAGSGSLVFDLEVPAQGGSPARVCALAVEPGKDRYFATGHEGGPLRLWDASTAAPVAEASEAASRSWWMGLSFSPDGSRLASSLHDGRLDLWEVPTLKAVHSHHGRAQEAHGLAFSPDGRRLARGNGPAVQVLDARTLEPVDLLEGHTAQVHCVAYSPDGKFLASGSQDRTVRLWEPAAGRLLGVLKGHHGAVFALAFHPESSRLAAGSEVGSVRIWDPHRGAPLTQLRGHAGGVYGLVFSPDGSRLFSGGADRAVRLWDTQPQWMRWQARHRRARRLEEVEPMVSRLFEELKQPERVVERLRSDRGMDEAQRSAALQAALMRAVRAREP